MAFGKDLRLAPRSFMSHFPPDPRFYGGARGMRKQLRPARKPHERCLCLLTAVLLNKPDHLLLQDTMRLSGSTYTVGGGGRIGPLFVCRGRCPHRPEGGHTESPLRKRIFFWGASPLGEFHKGGSEAPFWSFQGERVLRERGPIPPVRGKCRAQRDKGGRDNSKSPSPLTALW